MKNRKRLCRVIIICLCTAVLTGCQGAASANTVETTQGMTAEEVAGTFENENQITDWKAQEYKTIRLEDGSTEINVSGIYELTGTQKDGSISVNVDKNTDDGIVYLVLNNASVASDTTAPIYIKEAEKVVLILEDGTVNTVTQGRNVATDESGNPSSAIFSKADLTISGSGTLEVTSEFNDGITGKDSVLITGGIIQVTAVNDGITGKDLLAVETADITIDAGKDGMRATNDTDASKGNITIADGNFQITAGNDAIQAEQILQIDGGNFDLSSGGGYPGQSIKTSETGRGGGGMRPDFTNGTAGSGDVVPPERTEIDGATETATEAATETATEETVSDSKKGLKAGSQVIVNGGNFTISTYEDSVHSNGDVTISGGIWNIEAGDDAIHADTTVLIEKGEITISGSYEGIEGSDITIKDGTISVVSSNDGLNVSSQSGTLTIDGGTLTVASGGDGLDSNGNIVQNGGTVTIHTDKVGAGDTPVDYDGTFTSNGGTLTDQNGDAIDYENQQMGGGRGQMRPEGAAGQNGQSQTPPDGAAGQTDSGQTPPEGAPGGRMQRRNGGTENESSSENL